MTTAGVLFLGIDFGTTFSSVSYAIMKTGDNVPPRILTARFRQRCERVPSTLNVGPNVGPNVLHSIPSNATTLKLLKLSLPHEEDLPDHPDHVENLDQVRQAIRMIRHTGMKGVEAVAEYLRRLWKDCQCDIIENAMPVMLEDMAVRIVFTIPASWGEDAICRTRHAVEASGILKIGRGPAAMEFLTETEAAALAILPQFVNSTSCEIGDFVVICDCGGGTVDIGSYEVTSLSPLTVRECVPGESQLCGAIYLRSAFSSLIDQRFATSANLGDNANIDKERSVSQAGDFWETEIPKYHVVPSNWSATYRAFLHGDGVNPSGPSLEISGDEVAKVYRSVTTSIIAMISNQVQAVLVKKQKLPKLFVTGGFGCNKFLQQELRARFESIIRFTDFRGTIAVSSGATVGALRSFGNIVMTADHETAMPASIEIPIHIESRIARVSYGYRCGAEAGNGISWFIQKGDDIGEGQVKQFDLPFSVFAQNIDQGCHYAPIYRAYDVNPASPSTRQAVDTYCRIKWKGEPWVLTRNFTVNVRAHLYGRTMRFEVEMNGQRIDEMGMVSVEVLRTG